jgi:hypothetical protein
MEPLSEESMTLMLLVNGSALSLSSSTVIGICLVRLC